MPKWDGGEAPMPSMEETEYGGHFPLGPASVDPMRNEDPKTLRTHERSRMAYLTGQEEDAEAQVKREIFYGNDRDFSDAPDVDPNSWPD